MIFPVRGFTYLTMCIKDVLYLCIIDRIVYEHPPTCQEALSPRERAPGAVTSARAMRHGYSERLKIGISDRGSYALLGLAI